LGSRFGAQKQNLSIIPVTDTLVHFDLNGLGDPLYRLIQFKRRKDVDEVDALAEVLEADSDIVETVSEQLETAWTEYGLQGAVLLYKWRDEVKQCVATEANAEKSTLNFLRARDPMLVLNVLLRARANLLLSNSPLAFERAFLEQSLISDDPRLVELARSTGYVKEALPAPPAAPLPGRSRLTQKK
jgi:hypothetical protein